MAAAPDWSELLPWLTGVIGQDVFMFVYGEQASPLAELQGRLIDAQEVHADSQEPVLRLRVGEGGAVLVRRDKLVSWEWRMGSGGNPRGALEIRSVGGRVILDLAVPDE